MVSFIENDNFTENFVKSNVLTKITFIETLFFSVFTHYGVLVLNNNIISKVQWFLKTS